MMVESSDVPAPGSPAEGFVHPFSPAGRADPYASFAWLREHSPVFHDRMSGMWFLTRHRDCSTALRDARFSAAEGQRSRAREDELPASMLTTDGVDHSRLRAPGNVLLGPSAMREHDPSVVDEVGSLLDRASEQGTVDAVSDLGDRYAVAILARVLELPPEDRAFFGELARGASVNLDPLAGPETLAKGERATADLNAYLHSHFEVLARSGADAPVHRLARDARLSRTEIVTIFSLCVVGGYEPLSNAVANTLVWILSDPALLRHLRTSKREDVASAVEEGLRLESPIPFIARVTTEDVVLGGSTIPTGERILAIISAANRDPEVVNDPDRFVVGRQRTAQLAFGGGPHFCLGAPLVRHATTRLLDSLLKRFRRVEPEDPAVLDDPPWNPSIVPRGLTSLPVGLVE